MTIVYKEWNLYHIKKKSSSSHLTIKIILAVTIE